MGTVNQEMLVMNWLRNHNGITQAEATKYLAVTRLPAIIWVLRHKRGFTILDKPESGKNRFGIVTYYKRYYLP